jgi:hypothetical protein
MKLTTAVLLSALTLGCSSMPAAPMLSNSFSGRIFGKVEHPPEWWFVKYAVKGDGLSDDEYHVVYKPMHRGGYFELDIDAHGVIKSFYVPKAMFDSYKEGDVFVCGKGNDSTCPPQSMPDATVSTTEEAHQNGAKEE